MAKTVEKKTAKKAPAKSPVKSEVSGDYAVVKIGAKQVFVHSGETLQVELLGEETGKKVTFSEVICARKGDSFKLGTPFISGASVTATLVGEEKGEKLIVFHKRRRKHSRKRTGHRQTYAMIQIDAINGVN